MSGLRKRSVGHRGSIVHIGMVCPVVRVVDVLGVMGNAVIVPVAGC